MQVAAYRLRGILYIGLGAGGKSQRGVRKGGARANAGPSEGGPDGYCAVRRSRLPVKRILNIYTGKVTGRPGRGEPERNTRNLRSGAPISPNHPPCPYRPHRPQPRTTCLGHLGRPCSHILYYYAYRSIRRYALARRKYRRLPGGAAGVGAGNPSPRYATAHAFELPAFRKTL